MKRVVIQAMVLSNYTRHERGYKTSWVILPFLRYLIDKQDLSNT
ncbi:MAG: hypothetical protein ACXVJJ_04915 [Halobacteriota archaeon]